MNLKLFVYCIFISFVIEIRYSISLPFNVIDDFEKIVDEVDNVLMPDVINEFEKICDDVENLIPKGKAYFMDDFGKPVMVFLDGINPNPCKPDRESIRFHLFTGINPGQSYQLFVDDIPLLKSSPFNSNYKTKILIHGFTNSIECGMIQSLKNAYLENSKVNVIAVDWGDLCGAPWYNSACTNTMRVGEHVAKFVDLLVTEMNLNLTDLHIIGHSLGAHTAGIVGKHLTTPGQISRITGLDPAFPLYSQCEEKSRLTTKDAKFVDVIHTSGGVLGILDPVGHIDFYPNGGVSSQPGCGLDLTASCSHTRSWELFGETVNNKNVFPTVRCASLKEAKHGKCELAGASPNMGEHAYYHDDFNNGLFYTRTKDKFYRLILFSLLVNILAEIVLA